MKELKFEKARFTGAEFKIGKAGVVTWLKVAAKLTRPAAKLMGVEYSVYDKDDTPKPGVKSYELDFDMTGVAVVFDVNGMGGFHLDLSSPTVDKFKVIRVGDKKRGKSTYVAVRFRFSIMDREQDLLEFLKKVAGAEGSLALGEKPRETQGVIEIAEPPKKARRAKAEPEAKPALVDGEDAPLREHNWSHNGYRATVRCYDDGGTLSALTTIAIDELYMGGCPVEWTTTLEGQQTIPQLGVAAMGQLESWAREQAQARGVTPEVKRALASLLSWSREIAGTYRAEGRIALEAVQ